MLVKQWMPWGPRFPAWYEVVDHVRKQEHRYLKRGGKISGVRMSKETWMRLCDNREMLYFRGKRDNQFGRPGRRHYDAKRIVGNPLNIDPDCPFGQVWVDGT